MSFDFDDEYEAACEKFTKENEKYLNLFEEYLSSAGLTEKTIHKHIRNVYFYLNIYLLREEPLPMQEGVYRLNDFLGYFFIRKCSWSTPATIKANAASIKKFYKCMLDHEKITKADYDYLCYDIKDSLATWQEVCAAYNDFDAPNPFEMF